MGTGNDLDMEKIEFGMSAFNIRKNLPKLKINGNDKRYLDFSNANSFVLTNALEGNFSCLSSRINGGKKHSNAVLEDNDESGLVDNEEEKSDGQNTERENFPETWIFNDFEADENGEIWFNETVPDTITSFIVSGFAMHPENGLGIAAQQELIVFQDFFIKFYLPYSVRLGEILKVEITVFNYIQQTNGRAEVTVEMMNNENQFEFVDIKRCAPTTFRGRSARKTIQVDKNTETATHFFIKVTNYDSNGNLEIAVAASTVVSGKSFQDYVKKPLRIENEGMTRYENDAKLFDLTENRHGSYEFDISIPDKNIIARSIHIEASVIGDLLGPALANVDNLM